MDSDQSAGATANILAYCALGLGVLHLLGSMLRDEPEIDDDNAIVVE